MDSLCKFGFRRKVRHAVAANCGWFAALGCGAVMWSSTQLWFLRIASASSRAVSFFDTYCVGRLSAFALLQLPDNADISRIAARFDNGVLMVTVKKSQAKPVDVQDIPIGGF